MRQEVLNPTDNLQFIPPLTYELLENITSDPLWDQNVKCLWNDDETARYDLGNIIPNKDGTSSIALWSKTYAGTFAELMRIFARYKSDQMQPLFSISLSLPDGRVGYDPINAPHYAYSSYNPHWKPLYTLDFIGQQDLIDQHLKAMGVQHLRALELPRKIDLKATIDGFFTQLEERIFTMPPLVLR